MEELSGLLVPEVAAMQVKPDSASEKYLEPKLCREVKKLNGLCYKFRSPANKSVPDRLVIITSFICLVEVKTTGQKPTPAQAAEHERIRAAGGKVFVIDRPSELDKFINYLKRLLRFI